ncbi:hypothetical protein [Leptolyngbya sp. FACHB-16]|uniref:hypothetical protein n=1 Tax=unclassified Leptolyngbya TaxID=2650499 RepID=UPI00168236B8|nr:hypothetical protein [Leptolyngbya sp. FACHB-16]MBD2153100.1 hypothetical protein [Leptolyngbya sp. FACHB-16]
MIPRDSRRNKPLAPDQIFSAGFRDGTNRRALHPQFQNNIHYLKGYAEGCRPVSESSLMIAFCQSSSLDSALQSIHVWEQDQSRLGIGSVALGYRTGYWVVLVTQDLHNAALPF